jgi:hypothetical protein
VKKLIRKFKILQIYLYVFGLINIITSFVIPLAFGDTVLWHPRNLPTDLMVGSMYLAMGIVMLCISKKPEAHKGFIDFIVMANIFHAIVMIVFAQKPSHIYLDAGFIGLMGVLPLLMYPWGVNRFLKYS